MEEKASNSVPDALPDYKDSERMNDKLIPGLQKGILSYLPPSFHRPIAIAIGYGDGMVPYLPSSIQNWQAYLELFTKIF